MSKPKTPSELMRRAYSNEESTLTPYNHVHIQRCHQLVHRSVCLFDGIEFAFRQDFPIAALEYFLDNIKKPISHILLSNDLYQHYREILKRRHAERVAHLKACGKTVSQEKRLAARVNGTKGGRPKNYTKPENKPRKVRRTKRNGLEMPEALYKIQQTRKRPEPYNPQLADSEEG